ncbi:hypothetical protein DB347_24435 [Opitutaceae bacterium EW11]|nr:hypothetical protein DB347_24435 [Opitutaceae bacterium EW11]
MLDAPCSLLTGHDQDSGSSSVARRSGATPKTLPRFFRSGRVRVDERRQSTESGKSYSRHVRQRNFTEPVAGANGYSCHAPCWRTCRASRSRGSSLNVSPFCWTYMGPPVPSDVILDTLRELAARLSVPLWLTGGVAVDFIIGRWTREHSDIDLNAFSDSRDGLGGELARLGYTSTDSSWLTFWTQQGTGRKLEVAFVDRLPGGASELHIPDGAPVGIPGRYPLRPGYMDLERWAVLGGVRFRVCSPEGEWLARSIPVVGGRSMEPKVVHDLAVLESVIRSEVLEQLKLMRHATRG